MAAERGFLVLADLTGYTAYLSSGELAHAPRIAGDLLETVVGRLEPPFRLAKLEGDAAFFHVEDGRADGSLLLDAVEAAYHAFRRRLRSIEAASACDCTACRTAPRLDLKLFVHHGRYLRQRIAGHDELAGRDVIVAHRLLKGAAAAAATGGFLQATAAAARELGIDRDDADTTLRTETLDGLGRVRTLVVDLEARWQRERSERRIDVTDAAIDLEAQLPADPATVWASLTRPELRTAWEGAIRISETTLDGRRGVGTRTRCITGRLASIEEIVDWQPFEHLGRRIAIPGVGSVDVATELIVNERGTHVRVRTVGTGGTPLAPSTIEGLREEGRAALARLADVVGPRALDVIQA